MTDSERTEPDFHSDSESVTVGGQLEFKWYHDSESESEAPSHSHRDTGIIVRASKLPGQPPGRRQWILKASLKWEPRSSGRSRVVATQLKIHPIMPVDRMIIVSLRLRMPGPAAAALSGSRGAAAEASAY